VREIEHAWVRPTVVVSECLGFAAVRYNGQILSDRVVRALQEHVDFLPICPEVGIGLGVPRDPIRIVSIGGEQRLVQPSTQADLSEAMRHFADGFLDRSGPVDGFILKNRSPSCGLRDVKVYPAEPGKPASDRTSGCFAEAVLRRYPRAAIEDEGRLTNARIRHHFLTYLFASAELRQVRQSGEVRELVGFHTRYKLQLLAQSQTGLRTLGRLVADPRSGTFEELVTRYSEQFAGSMARPPRLASTVNVLQHAYGYFSGQLTPLERRYFADLLTEYRAERLPLSSVIAVVRAWIVRFGTEYLAAQRFLEPYPRALLTLADSAARG
jgi:uncharacterized protein YbgA (DUF1722 family)/uncharacterized protein YbbK (DUF523 family)